MGQKEKIIAQIRENPHKVSFDALVKVLGWYGFAMRSGKGSHNIFKRRTPRDNYRLTLVRPHGGRKYVSREAVAQVLAILDELESAGWGIF